MSRTVLPDFSTHTIQPSSMPIPFHPLELADKEAIRKMVHDSACRNCDLNFMNLFSWRFLYDTEVAVYKHWLLFRFKADGHNAYMAPVGNGDWRDIVTEMQADAKALGHPFLMLGVCDTPVACLEEAMPGYFYAKADRNFSCANHWPRWPAKRCRPSATSPTALPGCIPTTALNRCSPHTSASVWN